MGMQSKVHSTHKTDRLMALACLELQRHGRDRWFVSHHPHTVLALVLVCAVGVFAPGVASAQGRDDRRDGHRRHGRHSPRRRRGGAGRGGHRAGNRHRRDRPVHVQRTCPGDV